MEQWVVVDGYNVINAWPALLARQQLNLQAARDDLLERLADYQGYWGGRVLVVFDASGQGQPGKARALGGDRGGLYPGGGNRR